MAPLPPELKRELQQDYIKTFPEKLSSLREALNQRDFDSLKMQFHKLAGSGKTYDMPEITELARSAEENLEQEKLTIEKGLQVLKELEKIFKKYSSLSVSA